MKLGCDHSQIIRTSALFGHMVQWREALHFTRKLWKKKNYTLFENVVVSWPLPWQPYLQSTAMRSLFTSLPLTEGLGRAWHNLFLQFAAFHVIQHVFHP